MPARRPLVAAIALAACAALARPACAAPLDSSARVPFGPGTLLLPVPQGFGDPSTTPPEGVAAMQRTLPDAVRLMAVLMDEAFMEGVVLGQHPHLSRYILVQTDRAGEAAGMSRADFDRLKAEMRTHTAAVMKASDRAAASGEARESWDLARRTGDTDLAISSGPAKDLGVFEDRPDWISIASTFTSSTTTKDGTRVIDQVVAQACVRIHGRQLTVSVYSDIDSPADIAWARQALHAYVLRLFALDASAPGR